MKYLLSILFLLTLGIPEGFGQRNLNAGLGFSSEAVTSPGIVLEIERESFHTAELSLPARLDITFMSTPDYYGFNFDVHQGFRRYFSSGLFLEQSIGIGVAGKSFKGDDYWYQDKYGSMVPHGGTTVWGLMPSVSSALGYSFPSGEAGSNLVWIRPKVFWDLGIRALNTPYFALQIGYTHTIKTR